MYKATTKNNVITENTTIITDGFSCITLKNIGADAAKINDNIPLAAGSSYVWDNHPNVTIDENTSVRFDGVEVSKKVLIIRTYFKEVR